MRRRSQRLSLNRFRCWARVRVRKRNGDEFDLLFGNFAVALLIPGAPLNEGLPRVVFTGFKGWRD